MERERSCRWSRLPGGRHRTQKPVSPGSYALPGVATCRESRRLPGVPEWGTLPRLSLSTEFFLPLRTRARFPGRVIRSTGHSSSIRTSLDRARDKANGAPGTAVSSGHQGERRRFSGGPLGVGWCRFRGAYFAQNLYHTPPASATNSARVALGSAGQDQGPPGAPVEGCADTAPALSNPDTAGWVPLSSAAAGWHHFDGA